ncbi:hypothetical protein GGP77_001639 [Salinibacter ruber]|uniref:hypothetical protein n=1 Tax=Salinibacter ruber TaxID=146919 RepID=UPI00216733C3|nr:hypothetical protein [Salinibacter ruber]MCS3667410.1 hypothetical protein [Salinibacter ruber]
MKYLLLNDISREKLDEALYALAAPEQGHETQAHVGGAVHPDTGQEALRLPDSTSLLLQPHADIGAFADLIEGALGPDAAQETVDLYEQHVGERVRVEDMLTAGPNLEDALAGQIRTRSEMEADGWFPEPTL